MTSCAMMNVFTVSTLAAGHQHEGCGCYQPCWPGTHVGRHCYDHRCVQVITSQSWRLTGSDHDGKTLVSAVAAVCLAAVLCLTLFMHSIHSVSSQHRSLPACDLISAQPLLHTTHTLVSTHVHILVSIQTGTFCKPWLWGCKMLLWRYFKFSSILALSWNCLSSFMRDLGLSWNHSLFADLSWRESYWSSSWLQSPEYCWIGLFGDVGQMSICGMREGMLVLCITATNCAIYLETTDYSRKLKRSVCLVGGKETIFFDAAAKIIMRVSCCIILQPAEDHH